MRVFLNEFSILIGRLTKEYNYYMIQFICGVLKIQQNAEQNQKGSRTNMATSGGRGGQAGGHSLLGGRWAQGSAGQHGDRSQSLVITVDAK